MIEPHPTNRPAPRLLFHVFPTFAVGGSQMRFAQLVAAHRDRYRHLVLTLDGNRDMSSRLPADTPVEVRTLAFDKAAGLGNLPLFRRTIAAARPDLLLTYNWGAIEWALANRLAPLARHVHIEDGFGPEERERQLARRIWLRRLALTGGHSVVVVPSRQLERIALEQWRLSRERVRYIPNGVDCARFAASSRPAPGPVVIGTVATLRPEKNVGRLIRAFDAVAAGLPADAVELRIVGDGPEREPLEALARSSTRRARIVFTGATARPEAALAEMDVFALTSDTEQMPLSVLEAMAAGLPVVSVAVGDVPDMVSEENRPFVTSIDDEPAFQENLRRLIHDATLRRDIGAANRREATARFGQQMMIDRYADLFG